MVGNAGQQIKSQYFGGFLPCRSNCYPIESETEFGIPFASDAENFGACKDEEQFGLKILGEFTYFVQENDTTSDLRSIAQYRTFHTVSACRSFKDTHLGFCSGKGSLG